MSDDFSQNKRKVGKGLSFAIIYATFSVFFGLAYFTLGSNQCYTIKTSDVPVSIVVHPNANDTTAWFTFTLGCGFWSYAFAAGASLGYLSVNATIQKYCEMVEKLCRWIVYGTFIAVHVMRLSHTGSVCAGDYLPSEDRDDLIV